MKEAMAFKLAIFCLVQAFQSEMHGQLLTNVETLRKGGNVPAIVFDGQIHRILACSSQGKPLTIFQLQNQCWEAVKNMSKSEIVIYIEYIIKSFHKHTVTILTSPTVIQVRCPDISSSNLDVTNSY